MNNKLLSSVAWTAVALAGVVVLLLAPAFVGPYYVHMLIVMFLGVGLAVSYRLLMTGGLVSLAHNALYGIGAYGFSILAVDHGWAFWPAVVGGALSACVVGLVIGTISLRSEGPYFFLLTFSFGVVAIAIIQAAKFTHGFAGLAGAPYPDGVTTEVEFYRVVLVAVLLVVGVFLLLDRSRFGLELRGIGNAPLLAESAGVNRYLSSLVAFVFGAMAAGILGGLYASFIGSIAPQSFDINVSISILTAVIVGGVRYFWGAVVGAVFVVVVPMALGWEGTAEAIFGASAVIVVMLLMRQGIVTAIAEAVQSMLGRSVGAEGFDLRATAAASPHPAESGVGARPFEEGRRIGDVVLEVNGLSKAFGGVQAVRDVDLAVRAGETLGVIGPNGSGKTTTFNLISGFIKPDSGTVVLEGHLLARRRPSSVVKAGLTRSFQASAVFEELTLLENVLVAVGSRRFTIGRYVWPVRFHRALVTKALGVLAEVDMAHLANASAKNLPYGHKKVLGLAIALATNPKVLCLDEPATGMTEGEIAHLVAVLRRVQHHRGLALIVIEHRLSLVRELCDRVVALRLGSVLTQGTPREVLTDPAVVEAFLGKTKVTQ